VYRGIRASNYLVIVLAALQCILVLTYELGFAHGAVVATDLYVDQLSIIMALIIAIIGGAICIYAIGYMRDYQEHREHEGSHLAASGEPSRVAEALEFVRDRRHIFFAIMFLFLGAMFAVVFANRLSWFLTGWEVLTLCSFLLIGFSRTEEATKNAFKAAAINVSGGVAFSLALIVLALNTTPIFELDALIVAATGGILVLPVMLIAFAGMTKAAQMPFQGWLLGAMVAPTPVSALLHSSTMVKAGVFIIIKLAPALGWNVPGFFVLIMGGLTFLGCTALAISQSNAKRVLAYSTVANLGLIVCCAGIGTPEAAWAAIFLLVFHAAAKALLFCCVGTAEHHLGSRDIEQLDNIFVRMPWIATFLAVGMMAMFIAPFGMLVSKWAALVSIAQSGHLELLLILAFGSAMTFVVWAKWLGKALAVGNTEEHAKHKVYKIESSALVIMTVILIGVTLALPLLSDFFVMPYLQSTGVALGVLPWITASNVLGFDNLIIMSIVFLVLMALLAVQLIRKRPASNDTVYMAGIGSDSQGRSYTNSFGKVYPAGQRNWYMENIFGEKTLGRQATILIAAIMGVFLILGIVLELMSL
jgi:ech hydrogenase subunit A